MRVATVAEIKTGLSSFLKASASGPVVITRKGKAIAVLLGVEDDEELEGLLLAQSPKLRAILDAAEKRIDRGAGIPHDEFWRQVGESKHRRPANGNAKKRRPKRRI